MLYQQHTQDELIAEIHRLHQEITTLQQENSDLEIRLETILEHSTEVENALEDKHREIQGYTDALRLEMEAGRRMQTDLLPQALPDVAGWEITTSFQPAFDVAGDFYDVFTLSQDQVVLVIADVSGKGVGAALFMSLMLSLIRMLAYQASTRLLHLGINAERYFVQLPRDNAPPLVLPAFTFEILNTVKLANHYIATHYDRAGVFATLFFGVLDTQTGAMSYINAGHELPIHLGRDGTMDELIPGGLPIGILPDSPYDIYTIQLQPGDILMIYTDGILDACNHAGEFFTKERLLTLIKETRHRDALSAPMVLQLIHDAVQAYMAGAGSFDDMTMLAVRRLPMPCPVS